MNIVIIATTAALIAAVIIVGVRVLTRTPRYRAVMPKTSSRAPVTMADVRHQIINVKWGILS